MTHFDMAQQSARPSQNRQSMEDSQNAPGDRISSSTMEDVQAKTTAIMQSISTGYQHRVRDRHALPPSIRQRLGSAAGPPQTASKSYKSQQHMMNPQTSVEATTFGQNSYTSQDVMHPRMSVDAAILGHMEPSQVNGICHVREVSSSSSSLAIRHIESVEFAPDSIGAVEPHSRPPGRAGFRNEIFGETISAPHHEFAKLHDGIHQKRKPSQRLSETVMGFGRRVKKGLEDFVVRKDSGYSSLPGDGASRRPTKASIGCYYQAVPTTNPETTSPHYSPASEQENLLGRQMSEGERAEFERDIEESEQLGRQRHAESNVRAQSIVNPPGYVPSNEARRAVDKLMGLRQTTRAENVNSAASARRQSKRTMNELEAAVWLAETRGMFNECSIDQRFGDADSSRTTPAEQMAAAEQQREEIRAEIQWMHEEWLGGVRTRHQRRQQQVALDEQLPSTIQASRQDVRVPDYAEAASATRAALRRTPATFL